jgi:hypothetical protein
MSLSTNLVSYWKLDEASGDAADSKGSNTLSNIGTMTYATGKINNGAVIATGKYLKILDAAQTGLDLSGDFTLGFWVKFNSLPGVEGEMYFINKYGGSSGTDSYLLELYNAGGTLELYGVTCADGSTPHAAEQSWTPSTATWYYVNMVYTASAHTVKFYINGSAISVAIDVTDTSIYNGTAPFVVGAYNNGSNTLDGIMDEIGVWSRVLSETEIYTLYNSGRGLQYPFDSNLPLVQTVTHTHVDVSANTSSSISYDSGSTGSNKCLVVFIYSDRGSASSFAGTYNGVALTFLTEQAGAAWSQSVGYLKAPAAGSNTLALTFSISNLSYDVFVVENVDQTTQINASASQDSGSPIDPAFVTVTTTANNCLAIANLLWQAAPTLVGIGVSQTELWTGTGIAGHTPRYECSIIAMASSGDADFTVDLSTTSYCSYYGIALNYGAGAAGPTNLKTYNTNAKANIKSINTNLIANVKSLNTNV